MSVSKNQKCYYYLRQDLRSFCNNSHILNQLLTQVKNEATCYLGKQATLDDYLQHYDLIQQKKNQAQIQAMQSYNQQLLQQFVSLLRQDKTLDALQSNHLASNAQETQPTASQTSQTSSTPAKHQSELKAKTIQKPINYQADEFIPDDKITPSPATPADASPKHHPATPKPKAPAKPSTKPAQPATDDTMIQGSPLNDDEFQNMLNNFQESNSFYDTNEQD